MRRTQASGGSNSTAEGGACGGLLASDFLFSEAVVILLYYDGSNVNVDNFIIIAILREKISSAGDHTRTGERRAISAAARSEQQ